MNRSTARLVIVFTTGLAIAAFALGRDEPDQQSDERRLSNPTAIHRGPTGWQPPVGDTSKARLQTLVERATNRAYDGAPPVMAHSRSFVKTKSCLDCHADGFRLGKRFGPALSHPHLVQCVQCHVESRNLDVPPSGPPVPNFFEGTTAPFGVVRPWTGAPPVIPHTTLMRTDCLSCHGPNGYAGLRTDHAGRTNCVQCHAVAATLDQASPFFTGNSTMLLPSIPAARQDAPRDR